LNDLPKVAVLMGPTAVGKTELSIWLAKLLNAEIISGDSMQIYKEMDIGTAKISKEEMDDVPHHLIDIKDPHESFSAAEFQKLVHEKILKIHQRGKLPMIVGGTGLYIQSVLYDYQFSEAAEDPEFRKQMEQLTIEKGVQHVYDRLLEVDPLVAQGIHPNNVRRVIRALEVQHVTGKTMSNHQEVQIPEPLYDHALIGLTMDRDLLYSRINQRVDGMIKDGLINEVQTLFENGIRHTQSMQAIGYKEIVAYLEGEWTREEAIEALKQNSRRYAKRQLTWFRNKLNVEWFDMTSLENKKQNFDRIYDYVAGKLHLKANN
jgi:tRNA dimethylallyltransferase